MQAKEYQRKALERLALYLGELNEAKFAYDQAREELDNNPKPGMVLLDFTVSAWDAMAERGEVGRPKQYSPRKTGTGEPVPFVTFKVPTGGGKTFLAVQSLGTILDQYFDAGSEKFVLWIVPSEAIYSQTKRHLQNREGPLRKALDISSGNRVRILEKESPLHRADLKGHLTIMLLMLPSANRSDAVNKLKMFRDRGNVNGFLPDEDDLLAHEELKKAIPNLDVVDMSGMLSETPIVGQAEGMIRSSLGNALRMVRPLIILDEGHKGISELAQQTLYGFNPRFVLELSATPKAGKGGHSNWLVNISGAELESEQMIKMPVMLKVTAEHSWQTCVREAWQQIEELQAKADEHRANCQQYIRPILLVQVERTGKDQREAGFVHTDDVREYLVELGLNEDAIAVKTSQEDELKSLEVKNLLDPQCPVRVIITKQALQEGWDCSFAYVLCSLAVSRSATAMTQLVGRILRQPNAVKTGIPELDQCYVYTYRQETKAAVEMVQRGLDEEGLGDLTGKVISDGLQKPVLAEPRTRKEGMGARKFYLPQVLVVEGPDASRPLDWEVDILGSIEWSSIKFGAPETGLPKGAAEVTGTAKAIHINKKVTDNEAQEFATEFDPFFALRALGEVVPNPWIAEAWVNKFLDDLVASNWSTEELGQRQQYVVTELVRHAKSVVDLAAREVFEAKLGSGHIVFDLVVEKWWSVPDQLPSIPISKNRLASRNDGRPFEKALFPPVYEHELNGLELKVACFVDREQAVWWWYKNVVKDSGYGLQGWRRNRIYPDFIIAQEKNGEVDSWLVIESKGDHLKDNDDSSYKRELMSTLTESYETGSAEKLGQLKLFEGRAKYSCEMVSDADWETSLKQKF